MFPPPDEGEIRLKKLTTLDAITISLKEAQEARNFINFIPRLKSVKRSPELQLCAEALIFELKTIKPILNRLRHLKKGEVRSDTLTLPLKDIVAHSVDLWKTCSASIQGADELVREILARKLDDLSASIDSVIQHVGDIQRV